jgi:hypothetical protein
MSGTSQATVAVSAPSFAKRKARALIGWLPEQEGALWIGGRDEQAALDPAHLATCRSAQSVVAGRPAGLDQTGAIADLPALLQPHIAAFRASPWGAAAMVDSGEPRLVDLRRIAAAQPVVHTEDAMKRVAGLTTADVLGIARITLPIPPATPPLVPVMFDSAKNAHIVSSASPNLRVLTHIGVMLGTPDGRQVQTIGFAIAQQESFLQVGAIHGRYFLRDGYHRAYGLLAAGITHAPALVRDFPSYPEARMPAGLLSPDVFLGDRPPTLLDYHDDAVSVDTSAPITTKMIVVQALEITPLG